MRIFARRNWRRQTPLVKHQEVKIKKRLNRVLKRYKIQYHVEKITTSLNGAIIILLSYGHIRKEVLDKVRYTWKQEINEVLRGSVSRIDIDEKWELMRIVMPGKVMAVEVHEEQEKIMGTGMVRYCRHQGKEITFAVGDSNMADTLRRAKITIGGQIMKVEFNPTAGMDIQCLKYAQWGHIKGRCVTEGARCFIYTGKHETSDHLCLRYGTDQKCGHIGYSCSNCEGKPRADDSMCKVGRMVRQQAHIHGTDTRSNEQINRLKTRVAPRPWF